MLSEDIFLKIVSRAVKAPSGHNTQPWLFSKEAETICIEPDFNRSLPVADPAHRELFISLGCAAETAMIAAGFFGYYPEIKLDFTGNQYKIKIALQKDENLAVPELFAFINYRQTTRNLYESTQIQEAGLLDLKQSVTDPGIGLRLYTGEEEIGKFIPRISEANAIQMSDPGFKKELIHWMRFSQTEAMSKGDGLYTACSGVPAMGRAAGSFVIRNFVNAKSEEKRLLKQLKNTAALALFTTKSDSPEDWVKTGINFQRFALTATKLNLSHSYLNLPCQVQVVRNKMMLEPELEGGYPQLLIRLGYSEKMQYAFRRRVYQVITEEKAEKNR